MTAGWGVATPHAAASRAGADVLAEGGNAVDAALAAATVLAVAYPHQCSVGGDAIALVGTADGTVHAMDGSGRAPAALGPDALPDGVAAMPERGPFSVTVPGAVAAWSTMAERWGTRPLADPLRHAAALAANGVPVSPGLARSLAEETALLVADPGLREVLAPSGEVLAAGQPLRQPRLAATLEQLAEDGPSVLYGGPVGASVVRTLRDLGSPVTEQDLAAHETWLGEPIATSYAGVEHLTTPPASQGAFFLEGLAALHMVREAVGRELDPLGDDAGLVVAVLDAAARDRDAMLGDRDTAPVDVEGLLAGHARAIATDVLAGRPPAAGSGRPGLHGSGDTVAIVTADGRGGWVSLIQSNFHAFGSGILDPGTGIVLHDRGASFSLDPVSPNVLAGGRRPAHTLMPVLVRRDGALVGAHGTMGGRAQPQIHTLLALHLAGARPPEEAVSLPRWVLVQEPGGTHGVRTESDVPEEARAALASKFRLEQVPSRDDGVGHAQVVRVAEDRLVAASDPRADGVGLAG